MNVVACTKHGHVLSNPFKYIVLSSKNFV